MKEICIPHLWIPMPNGTRLIDRLWLPEDTTNQIPAIH